MFYAIAAMAALIARGGYRSAGVAVQRRRRSTAAEKRCQLDVRLSVGPYRFSGGRGGGGGRCDGGRRWARVQVGRRPLQTERCRCIISFGQIRESA